MESVSSRSRSNSGLNFLSLLEKSYRTPPGSDYLVTTMKLRDRVTSVKTPTRRTTKLTLKSAPPFQNRNLDNYPMPHSREDVLNSAKGRRSEKQMRDRKNASSRVYSGNMRDYSKQMFDFAVLTAKKNSPTAIKQKKSAVNFTKNIENNVKTTKWANDRVPNDIDQDSRTNGPTPDGSILYNRRQRVLNSIRIRPKSECEGQYTHDRSVSRLSVHETILEKNQHYRVLNLNEVFHPGTTSGRTTSCSTDVLLVPVDQCTEKDFNNRERTFTESINDYPDDTFSELAKNESRASTCDPFDDKDIIDGRRSRERSRLLPPSSSCNIRLVSLDEHSSSESEEEPEEQAPPPPPPEPKKQEPKTPVKKNSKITIPEPEPEIKPEKVKVVLKGPKCWVDDATITSDESDHELEDEVIEPEPPAPQMKNMIKGVLNMRQNLGVMSKLMNSKESPVTQTKDLSKNNKGQANKEIVKEVPKPPPEPVKPEPVEPEPVKEEVQPEPEKEPDKPVSLPPFLCPSSEKKSREAAIKDWLEHSCFHSASSAIPLI